MALAALDAHVDIAGPVGKYTIPIGELYDPLGITLKKGELLLRIRIPRSETTSKQAFIKFRVRQSVDFAIASVACVLDIHEGFCRQARIVLGGVAPAPWRVVDAETALIGETITSETAAAAAMAATAKAKPLSRNEYKVALVKALIQRAVLQAAEEK